MTKTKNVKMMLQLYTPSFEDLLRQGFEASNPIRRFASPFASKCSLRLRLYLDVMEA